MGVEELVRTFDYKERPEIFKYYPQYYHKIDKVCCSLHSVHMLHQVEALYVRSIAHTA